MTKRKIHWTQRPENKAKVKKMAKRSAKTRAKHVPTRGTTPTTTTAMGVATNDQEKIEALAIGYFQAKLETFAERAGVPIGTLAYRVGKALQLASRR